MKKKEIVILGVGVFLLGILLYLLGLSIEHFQNQFYQVEDIKVNSEICNQYELYYQGRKEKIYTDCSSKIEFKVNGQWLEGKDFLTHHSMSMVRTINLIMNHQELTLTKYLMDDAVTLTSENFSIVECSGKKERIFYMGRRTDAPSICLELGKKEEE